MTITKKIYTDYVRASLLLSLIFGSKTDRLARLTGPATERYLPLNFVGGVLKRLL